MAKEGSTIGGLMDTIGTETSLGLQYGVPLRVFVDKFSHTRFEPSGWTTNQEIPHAKSVVDYIFRWLGIQFIPGYREANTPKREPEAGAECQGRTPKIGPVARQPPVPQPRTGPTKPKRRLPPSRERSNHSSPRTPTATAPTATPRTETANTTTTSSEL